MFSRFLGLIYSTPFVRGRVKLVVDTRIMSVRIKVILGRRDKNCLEASTHERGKNRVSLPKLEMKKFGGDPVVWPEFYKIF